MTLSPNDFSCIEDYLSNFKTLILLCIGLKLDMKEDRCIYVILVELGSAFLSLFLPFMKSKKL
jgi:hypothetical protein